MWNFVVPFYKKKIAENKKKSNKTKCFYKKKEKKT